MFKDIAPTILNPNGRSINGRPAPGEFEEIGTVGIDAFGGFIQKAYNTKLYWPAVEPVYSRMWRSDPEVSTIRNVFDALSGEINLTWELPEMADMEPTDDDQRQVDFAYSVLEDIEGGVRKWLSAAITRTPFYGFAPWEIVLGLRKEGWRPPNDDPWTSQYNDGLVGIRRLAWRDYGSFDRWEMDDYTGRVMGMVQLDHPNPEIMIPKKNLLHLTYGDHDNPEGLATLEAMWRLEYIKRNYEMVMGIGSEHAAGHVVFEKVEIGQLNATDKTALREAAKSMLSAQEGNYVVTPYGFTAKVEDVTFSALASLLETAKYYGILKLTLLGMQWVALSAQTGAGSFASMKDSSSMHLLLYNSMVEGFVDQTSRQLGAVLFDNEINKAAFPGATRKPQLKASRIEKDIDLTELATFAQTISSVVQLGDEDIISIRTKSGVLSENLPDVEEVEDTAAETESVNPGNIAAIRSTLLDVRQQEMTVEAAVEILVAAGMNEADARKAAQSQFDAEPIAASPIPGQSAVPTKGEEDDPDADKDKNTNEPTDAGELAQAVEIIQGREMAFRDRLAGTLADLKEAIFGMRDDEKETSD